MKQQFGLIGKKLTHSFSPDYFKVKFQRLGIHADYHAFEINSIHELPDILKIPGLVGLNVTIPYKQQVVQYVDHIDSVAKNLNAVNTLLIKNGETYGYNTDVIGFDNTLQYLKMKFNSALILGSGGASQAVQYVLKSRGINFEIVSTQNQSDKIKYEDVTSDWIKKTDLIINTTPLGMYPNLNEKPLIPYRAIDERQTCIDLIYNPAVSLFLQSCMQRGARVMNGKRMLVKQAEASWKIWKSCVKPSEMI